MYALVYDVIDLCVTISLSFLSFSDWYIDGFFSHIKPPTLWAWLDT